jgi:hypothetical protein
VQGPVRCSPVALYLRASPSEPMGRPPRVAYRACTVVAARVGCSRAIDPPRRASPSAITDLSPGGRNLLDEIEGRLRSWVARVEPSASVSLARPGESRTGLGASLHLVEVAPNPPPRGIVRPPLQLWLRYLVTTWAEEPGSADRLLVELALDAMEQSDLEVDFEPPSAHFWIALRSRPQPSFVIRLPVARQRPRRRVERVLHPLVIKPGYTIRVGGVVLGPDEMPISNATVEIVGMDHSTKTDRRGRFSLTAVPGPPVVARLRARAKGTEVVLAIPDDAADGRPISIRLDPLGRENGIPHT